MNEKLLNWVLLALLIVGGLQFVSGAALGAVKGTGMLEALSGTIGSLTAISWLLLIWVVIYKIFSE